jgi:hypothetical protein
VREAGVGKQKFQVCDLCSALPRQEGVAMSDNALAVVVAWTKVYATASARRVDPNATFEKLQERLPDLTLSDLLAGADVAKAISTELRSLGHRLSELERRSGKR